MAHQGVVAVVIPVGMASTSRRSPCYISGLGVVQKPALPIVPQPVPQLSKNRRCHTAAASPAPGYKSYDQAVVLFTLPTRG